MLEERLEDAEDHSAMRQAKTLSTKSTMSFQLGAVVYKKGRVIGRGYNSRKTHPKWGGTSKFLMLHAECAAMYDAEKNGHDLSGCTIYVYRKNNTLARPCPSCVKIMREHGIRKVFYS